MPYLGSKAADGVYQTIIAHMPPHEIYIEPFLGTGIIMEKKRPARLEFGYDLNSQCVDLARSNPSIRDRQAVIMCMDSIAELQSLANAYESGSKPFGDDRVLIYADPPYLWSTRGKARYEHDLTFEDHERLLGILQSLVTVGSSFSVMLSGYPNALYDAVLSDWRTHEFQAMTRGGVRTEKLWMSFPAGVSHWYDYAGTGYVDRQRIQRKAQRWARNYASMPPGERQAVLATMLKETV